MNKDSLKKMNLSFPVILLPSASTTTASTPPLSSTLIGHIETVKRVLGNEKYAILFFQIDESGRQYRAYTHEGWHILFSTLADARTQAQNLKTLLQTAIQKKRKSLDYVDVRFDTKLFYTFRN
jgi:hypothetical protein